MKPLISWTLASDPRNIEYARKMTNSLRKFHSEEELPLITYGAEDWNKLKVENPLNEKRMYPYFTKELLKEYETVIHFDADQIITGRLDFRGDFDIAAPYNWNRVDPAKYGEVKVWDIDVKDYFNIGLFVAKSEEFVNHWWDICNSPHINNYQYIEQDLFNIVAHYGNYKVKRLDDGDAWYGLRSKGEGLRMKVVNNELILPKADDGYPVQDTKIKVIHFAGGTSDIDKFNYKIFYNDQANSYLDSLVK